MTSFAGPRSIGTPFLRILSHNHFYKHLKTLKTCFFIGRWTWTGALCKTQDLVLVFFKCSPISQIWGPRTWLVPMQWCVHVRQDSGCQGSNNKTAMKRCKGEMVADGFQLRFPYMPTASKSCSRFVVSGPSKTLKIVCSSIPPSFNIGKSGRGRVWKWARGSSV